VGLHVHRIPPRFFAAQPLEAHEDDLAHDHGRIFAAMERPRGYTPTQAAQLREPHPRANEILGPQTQELIELVLAIDRAAH